MSYATGLQCRECGKPYPKEALYVCEDCFGPLEVVYDLESVAREFPREKVTQGPPSMWRYRPLLPLDNPPAVGLSVGMTPLIPAPRLGEALGLDRLYLKNDTVNCPSLSFKDRVVAVAVSRALELGFDTVACASTGNLANALAAQAAAVGLKSYIFIPEDVEQNKITNTLVYAPHLVAVQGNYDEVNRLCTEIASTYPWAFVNITLRPYYSEGSKTFAFEVAEQLGWRTPDHIVVPVAGCSLLTKIWKGFQELETLGWIPHNSARIYAAQPSGCAPVTTAIKSGARIVQPVKPRTLAKSLAIGNPADGHYGLQAVQATGGYGEDVCDEEILEGMLLLARTEGIFAETAGGVVVGVAKKLAEQGRIGKKDLAVLALTGNGLKTQEVLVGETAQPARIAPNLDTFARLVEPDIRALSCAVPAAERRVHHGHLG